MNKITLILTLLFFSIGANAQKMVTSAELKDNIGQEVILKGKFINFKSYTARSGKNYIFIDIDKKYPETDISVTVFEEAIPNFKFTSSDLEKTIYVKGTVSIYKEKPQIAVNDMAQMWLEPTEK